MLTDAQMHSRTVQLDASCVNCRLDNAEVTAVVWADSFLATRAGQAMRHEAQRILHTHNVNGASLAVYSGPAILLVAGRHAGRGSGALGVRMAAMLCQIRLCPCHTLSQHLQ